MKCMYAYVFAMKSVNAVVHVYESESESMEMLWIIHGLVIAVLDRRLIQLLTKWLQFFSLSIILVLNSFLCSFNI